MLVGGLDSCTLNAKYCWFALLQMKELGSYVYSVQYRCTVFASGFKMLAVLALHFSAV